MYKQIADRERSSRFVVDAITQHASAIAAAHAERFGPAATRLNLPLPDVATLLAIYADAGAEPDQHGARHGVPR